jgi:dehydration protein DpgD
MGHLITGRAMSAGRAYELGLVNEVVPATGIDDCVSRWVEDILRCAPLAVRALKEVAAASAHLSLEEAFSTHYDAEELRRNSEDCRLGPLAFTEKRAPDWTAA